MIDSLSQWECSEYNLHHNSSLNIRWKVTVENFRIHNCDTEYTTFSNDQNKYFETI